MSVMQNAICNSEIKQYLINTYLLTSMPLNKNKKHFQLHFNDELNCPVAF